MLIFFLGIMWALLLRYHHVRKGLKALSGRILDAHEEERMRLARDLHDGIGQPLLAVKLHLQMLGSGAAAGTPIGKEAFPPLITEVSEAIEEVRHVAMDLRPSLLREGSLTEALRWYGRNFSEKTGTEIVVEGDSAADLPTKIKNHVFRTCQEALSNACKHSGADRVSLEIQNKGKLFSLTITDNGRGFEPSSIVGEARGIGLSTMKERIELLGGALHIRSAPGKGTAIEIEVPLS